MERHQQLDAITVSRCATILQTVFRLLEAAESASAVGSRSSLQVGADPGTHQVMEALEQLHASPGSLATALPALLSAVEVNERMLVARYPRLDAECGAASAPHSAPTTRERRAPYMPEAGKDIQSSRALLDELQRQRAVLERMAHGA